MSLGSSCMICKEENYPKKKSPLVSCGGGKDATTLGEEALVLCGGGKDVTTLGEEALWEMSGKCLHRLGCQLQGTASMGKWGARDARNRELLCSPGLSKALLASIVTVGLERSL